MKFTTLLSIAGALLLALSLSALAAPAPKDALADAIFAVETQKVEWFDAKRQRAVPATLHLPQEGAGPFPLLIISHGLGGTRDGLDYLGTFWAAHGYVCAQIQHIGSDDAVWRGAARPMQAMKAAAANPKNIDNRPADVHFAIDTLLRMNADPKSALFGRIDAAKIGSAGHSFGAFTAQAVAGRGALQKPAWRDPRVKACVAMSAPSQSLDRVRAQYADFEIPFYLLTGTRDQSPLGDTQPGDRRAPFDAVTRAEGYLLVLQDADHMTFGGRRRTGDAANDARDHDLILASTLVFWDAYLKGSADAKKYLRLGGFAKNLGDHGTFEMK